MVESAVKHTAEVCLLDQFEIISWVNFLDQISQYDSYSTAQRLDNVHATIFNMALTTKRHLNEPCDTEPILAHLRNLDPMFD